ncbi:MAG: DUF892 family protein [Verrucomicrobiota bacterium]
MNHAPYSELLFARIRDIYGLEKQLAQSLPSFSAITRDSELRERIDEMARRSVVRTGRLLALFATHRVRLGICVDEALKGVISGANMQLADMRDAATRDVLVAAHCLRIAHDSLASCEEAACLAHRSGFTNEWEQLANLFIEQQDTVQCFDRIGVRLFEEQVRLAKRRRKVARSHRLPSNPGRGVSYQLPEVMSPGREAGGLDAVLSR